MVQYGRSRRSSRMKIRMVILYWCWKGKLRKFCCSTVGQRFLVGNAYSCTDRKVLLICVCGCYQMVWKETKHWSGVESTQQRCRIRRTNIPWSFLLGMLSKTTWNTPRYCWHFQNHVRIHNFRRSSGKSTVLRNYDHFYMVLRYWRSCQGVCGTILRTKQLNNCYKVSWPPIQRRRIENAGRMVRRMCTNLLEMSYSSRNGRPYTMVSQQTCTSDLAHLISYIHRTSEYKQYSHVGNTAQQWRLELFQDSDFAGNLFDSNSTSGEHCVFGSLPFVTCVSRSSIEAKIMSLDAGLRIDGIPALDPWDFAMEVWHSDPNRKQNLKPERRSLSHSKTSEKKESDTQNSLELSHVDFVPWSATYFHEGTMLFIFDDNETVIKTIKKGNPPSCYWPKNTSHIMNGTTFYVQD